jgi:plastocyanin
LVENRPLSQARPTSAGSSGNHADMKIQPLVIIFAVVVFVTIGCMGSGGSTSGGGNGGGGGTVNVSMAANAYSPQVVNAHAGDTVTWTNNEAMLHTVTSDTAQAGLDSSTQFPGGINQNATFSWTVPANATIGTNFFYHCAFHGTAGNGSALGTGMAGQITVN